MRESSWAIVLLNAIALKYTKVVSCLKVLGDPHGQLYSSFLSHILVLDNPSNETVMM